MRKQASDIMKASVVKYFPNDPDLKNEDAFQKWVDRNYDNHSSHLIVRDRQKKAQKDKKCVIL